MYFWELADFDKFISELIASEYNVIGPTIQNEAIVYDEIQSIDELPKGYTEEQGPGVYKVIRRNDEAYFGYVVGPHSWKQFLFPSKETLWTAKKNKSDIKVKEHIPKRIKAAFIGVRSCDLKAIQILDKVFVNQTNYKIRRQDKLIVAINCIESGNNCFCTSMDSGPRTGPGYDLSMTEIVGKGFIVEAGSDLGKEWLVSIGGREASNEEVSLCSDLIDHCAENMTKSLDTNGIKELLYSNLSNPIWEEISQRCLSCANCTMVCPTCFCSTVEDHTDLAGTQTEVVRRWDSCFNPGHSHVHGGSVHHNTSSKYRQWMTHKLASWQDQFDSSGCTGCGRCITWCPVGIDFTEEAKKMRGEA